MWRRSETSFFLTSISVFIEELALENRYRLCIQNSFVMNQEKLALANFSRRFSVLLPRQKLRLQKICRQFLTRRQTIFFVLHSREYANGGIKTSRTEYQLAKLVN